MSNLDLSFEDEIDLRNIIKTIWKARKSVLIITLTLVVVAFSISKWVLPKQYKATAYVIIADPIFQYNQSGSDAGPEIVQMIPDVDDLMNLIISPAFLKTILSDQDVMTSFEGEEISPNALGKKLTVNSITDRQLSLRVTDSKAQRASLIANTWAEKVTEMINTTYGLNGMDRTLKTEVKKYQGEYEQTQASLEEALSTSQVSSLSSELDNSSLDLVNVLADISNANRVLDDLQFFEQGLSDIPGESLLSLGD
ncbi:MAG: Wzz/FepE/Etk N-terminal domain-containing protein, partial [Chloroflexota bacterium]